MSQPLAEVFGFPICNEEPQARRYRINHLCPYGNIVPNCTKDKADAPLGVCSVFDGEDKAITCPVRFREDWLIIEHAATFAFGNNPNWTSLSEVKLVDKNGQSAGNIDYVVVSYDKETKRITDFASLEVQGVYISGNLRNPFEAYAKSPSKEFEWRGKNTPHPDYLSSSRKRLVPQMLYKGGIFKSWGKKQCVAIQKCFYDTLPPLPAVPKENADIAWFLYDLVFNENDKRYHLTLVDVVYTLFSDALNCVITPHPGEIEDFVELLQGKFDEKQVNSPEKPLSLFEEL